MRNGVSFIFIQTKALNYSVASMTYLKILSSHFFIFIQSIAMSSSIDRILLEQIRFKHDVIHQAAHINEIISTEFKIQGAKIFLNC